MSTKLSGSLKNIRDTLVGFVDTLQRDLSARKLEAVLSGNEADLRSRDFGYKPESYAEDNLIEPLFSAANIPVASQPYGNAGGRAQWPDGEIQNVETRVISEHKPLNNVDSAKSEIKDYLDRKSIGADYGVATDGIEWYIYKIEFGGDFTNYPLVRKVDLRGALLEIARNKGYIASTGVETVSIDKKIENFGDVFIQKNFSEMLTQRVPRELRDDRKRNIQDFYELYIELIFGESDEYSYSTCLMKDIISPQSASDQDKRLFGINLMNRLIFIKFLEIRGILTEGFLTNRVNDYESNSTDIVGNLYETQIQPVFYKLLNTRPEDREAKYQDDSKWFSDVPYLNGGLFRESIENERQYIVNDRILPVIIRDLIEGSNLDMGGQEFNPAILGSVFEKTITYIEQERNQKDVGAYYTPNDITEIIIENSVNPAIREVLIKAIAEESSQTDKQFSMIQDNISEFTLPEILRRIEDGEGWFGNPDAVKRALRELRELRIVDPACGSGHFLTTTMDEIHRVQVSLLQCLNQGNDSIKKQRYHEKQALALNAIYGVDVDSIAVEIAKLRVWLKIIEGNGWEQSFGNLPNIDMNIRDGNSLVGLPMTGTFDNIDVWGDEIQQLEAQRKEYKQENRGSPQDIERLIAEKIRPDLNDKYVEMFSKPVESEINSIKELNAICEKISGPNLYPEIQLVRVKREDGCAFDVNSDDQSNPEESKLEELGFTVYTKSAKIDIQDRESDLKRRSDIQNHREYLENTLQELLQGPYRFSEVQRQPTEHDLEGVLGKPFHWMAEFPEIAFKKNGRHKLNFDVVIGNPPYGDLLSAEEDMFVSTYDTAGMNEIAAQFVERQLQLLNQGGYFGNVTTLGLVYAHPGFPDLLRNKLSSINTACFGLSGRTGVFDNALVRAAIFSGQKDSAVTGDIKTSDLILFTENNREERLQNIEYTSTDGLVLRDKIGGGNSKPVLPKVGSDIKRKVIEHLRNASDNLLSDHYKRGKNVSDGYPVWRSGSGGYWINPMLEKVYDGVEPLYFSTELHQRTGFLLLSSSLYYLHWITYGNQRNVSLRTLEAFPWPKSECINDEKEAIMELSTILWDRMMGTFQKAHTNRGRFVMSPLRAIIDDVDILVGSLFNMSDEKIDFLQQYHTNIGEGRGREGDPNADLSYNSIFEQ